MTRYQTEFLTLVVVEQHLLNAAGSLRAVEHHLGDGQLREEIRALLSSLERTVGLAGRAKRNIFREGGTAKAHHPAA